MGWIYARTGWIEWVQVAFDGYPSLVYQRKLDNPQHQFRLVLQLGEAGFDDDMILIVCFFLKPNWPRVCKDPFIGRG